METKIEGTIIVACDIFSLPKTHSFKNVMKISQMLTKL